MSNTIKHKKTNLPPAGPLISGQDWLEEHKLNAPEIGSVLVGDPSASDGASWVNPGTNPGYVLQTQGPSSLPVWVPVSSVVVPQVAQGRLTITSGDPYAFGSGASTLFYTPTVGNAIALYNGTIWTLFPFTERSLALSGLTSGKNYDVFLFDSAGTLTLELTAWTDDTTRATSLVYQDGVLVRSGALTRRYLGTIRATSATTTENSNTKAFVWNMHNRRKNLYAKSGGAPHTYNSATFRPYNNDATNAVEWVVGVDDVFVECIDAWFDTNGVANGSPYVQGSLGFTAVNLRNAAASVIEVAVFAAAQVVAIPPGYYRSELQEASVNANVVNFIYAAIIIEVQN